MLLTEQEAKTKWCPFARMPYETVPYQSGPIELSANRTKHGDGYGKCLASGCMAWRWEKELSELLRYATVMQTPIELRPQQEAERKGFCGLAGKPK